ncbi:GDSL-type esterase/lipase family protein [Desulfovibrio ferrophilus]|uniref:Lysophospholipase L1-like esterase n=1 Tax=Desulfovibrio ferrophilus TaxID=241368 RepID=A0A2Z6B2S7_9BACT|nr:GDSL-type esterase/lipase family protein [Desulfovibrio ferrophilus]BBD09763.1 lysophospholipase L1-like esterase [Desulfovibrio ferrophilus]
MVICFFGDSLVNGTGDSACLGWAGRICVPLMASGRTLTYYNLGVRKQATREILPRWEGEFEQRRLEGFESRLVFAFGTADTAILDGRRHVPLDETRDNAHAILSRATGLAPVLFVGPPPVADESHTARNREINSVLGTVCAELGVPYLDVFSRLAASDGYLQDVRRNDGVHPTGFGYGLISEMVSGWPGWQEWFV